ncbi:hypothetical protein NIES4074_48430 [Cylindrospermum sp. NIES-4074]|nr:hypothetical protein NIES4074_48430 [Cylindrospermum sp. NIES-4074]
MNKNCGILSEISQVKVKVKPGTNLILKLLIHSQITESWLFRAAIDDWVVDDSQIITMASYIDPAFVHLTSSNTFNQTVTLFIPSHLQPGQFLKSWLRFPALAEESILIEVEILSPEQQEDKHQAVEVCLEITLPFNLEKNSSSSLVQATAGIFGLMSGMIDLEKIPSRWLVAELLTILCQTGEEYIQTQAGSELFNQLRTTRFFENGVSIFASAQIPNWIINSLRSVNTILGGQSLLSVWQEWLLSLVGGDVQKLGETFVSPVSAEAIVSKIGRDGDRWFAGIILGLAHTSPQFATTLSVLASQDISTPTQQSEYPTKTHSLLPTLASLDIFPVRWLVVELLLILCQKGDQYAQTQAGKQLLQQLRSTHFLKNGVIAFTSAQVPRWLAISHQAAKAYQTSASPQINQGGLLNVGEQWLWSLVPTDINISQLKSHISILDTATDTFVTSLGMDAERWFSCLTLGLALVSPRIAETWCVIAQSPATKPRAASVDATSLVSPLPSAQTIIDSVLQQKGSLQR